MRHPRPSFRHVLSVSLRRRRPSYLVWSRLCTSPPVVAFERDKDFVLRQSSIRGRRSFLASFLVSSSLMVVVLVVADCAGLTRSIRLRPSPVHPFSYAFVEFRSEVAAEDAYFDM
jgi:hypothetical protein